MLSVGVALATLLLGYALGRRVGRIEGYVAGLVTELAAEVPECEEANGELGHMVNEHLQAQRAAAPWQ